MSEIKRILTRRSMLAAVTGHTIDEAAAAGKWDDAKASATSLNGLCGTCHAAHREREDDGTFRVKG